MSNPTITHRFKGEPRASLTMEKALHRHHAAVAKAMLSHALPEQVRTWYQAALVHPLVKADVEAIKPAREDIRDEWRPRGRESSPHLIEPEIQIADWYRVDPDLVKSFLNHLQDVKVGDFSQHPMWAVMALRDYN